MKITVKQARVGKGMTQEEMAKALGVSIPTYRVYEKKPWRMSYETLVKLAEIAGVELSDLDMEVRS